MSPNRSRRVTLRDLQQQLATLEATIRDLQQPKRTVVEERAVVAPKMAKGSSTIPVIREPEEERPLAALIEALLRARVMTYGEIVDEIGGDEKRLATAFAAMRRDGRVFNVGDETRPQWTWVVTDRIETRALRDVVERLVKVRPLTFPELMGATRANPNRLKHALTTLQAQAGLRNLGSRGKAVWFLPPPKPKR